MQNHDITLLPNTNNCATIDGNGVYVSRSDLEQEKRWLMTRLQQVLRLLDEPPLMTGAHVRKVVRQAGR
jgi:hypothetical protein